jgi:hypothetical protein
MKNPISDVVSNKRWWRENLGNLSLVQALSMLEKKQELPWIRRRHMESDWERLSSHFRSTGTSFRLVTDWNFETDPYDKFECDFYSENWFDYYNENLLWATQNIRRQIGFRIVRNK